MSDLTDRLRTPHPIDSRHDSGDPLCPCFADRQRREAADRIDALEAALREARTIVDEVDTNYYSPDGWDDMMADYPSLKKLWGSALEADR